MKEGNLMKKIEVSKELCIGCGACVSIDSEHFDFSDDGLAYSKTQENSESSAVMEAIESCPTDAISLKDDECTCEPCECHCEE